MDAVREQGDDDLGAGFQFIASRRMRRQAEVEGAARSSIAAQTVESKRDGRLFAEPRDVGDGAGDGVLAFAL